MRVITAPEQYKPENYDEVLCFLAGGITNCPDWQSEVIEFLKNIENNGLDLSRLVIFNPRRENFPINDPNAAKEQIGWEFAYLNMCNIFSMYFCNSNSDQPICMYELGKNATAIRITDDNWAQRIIVSVEDGYRRQEDVNIQMELLTYKDSGIVVNHATPKIHASRIINAYIKKTYDCYIDLKGDINE